MMKSWAEGAIPVAVSEEIKEASGGEEEADNKTLNLDFILATTTEIKSIKISKNKGKNYQALQEFKRTFFVPDFYSPPDYI